MFDILTSEHLHLIIDRRIHQIKSVWFQQDDYSLLIISRKNTIKWPLWSTDLPPNDFYEDI